jgi:hypothetical protein
MYKYLNPGDNRQVIVNKRKYFTTSRQITAHLLCRDCEQRFNRNGEQWVLANGFRGQGNFRLQSILKSSSPLGRARSQVFAGAELKDVDMDRLCYFGASVFWRAAVHRWQGEERIDLGPYQEEFRRYLIGTADFPTNAVLVVDVSDAEKPMEGAYCPIGGRAISAAYHQFTFMLPGILFTLLVGQGIPPEQRRLCAVRSDERLIFLCSYVQESLESIAVDMISQNEMVRREVLQGLWPRKV